MLNEIFDNYYKIQLSAEFIGREDYNGIRPFYHPTLIRTEDGTFQAAMLTLIYTERVSKAYRMYEVRRKMDHITPGNGTDGGRYPCIPESCQSV